MDILIEISKAVIGWVVLLCLFYAFWKITDIIGENREFKRKQAQKHLIK